MDVSFNYSNVGHLVSSFHLLYVIINIFFFLAALGLRCCVWAFSRCGECGLLFVSVRVLLIAVRVLLIAVASLVAELGL